jgi:hypothetical protein
MASRKHHPATPSGHRAVVEYLIDSGWESHPYVRDHRAKQAKFKQSRPSRGRD